MSIDAIRWAYKTPLKKASERLLLVSLADYADEDGLCFPSITTLVRKTLMNKRTIVAGLIALKEGRFIKDTGDRKGRTRSVIVYKVNNEAGAKMHPLDERKQVQKRTGSRCSFVPEAGAVLSTITINDPSLNHQSEVVAIPQSLDTPDFRQAFTAWVTYRKLPPVSQDALLRMSLRPGPAVATRAIQQAIAGQWQNVRFEDYSGGTKGQDFLRKSFSHMKMCRVHHHEFDTRIHGSLCPICYPDKEVTNNVQVKSLVAELAAGIGTVAKAPVDST